VLGRNGGWTAETFVGDGRDDFHASSAQEAVEKSTQWVRFMIDRWASGERPSRSLSDY
jgi:hypothetical protein